MSADFASLPLPKIRTKDGAWTYQLRPLDLLNAARSVQGEGVQDAAEVLWTYMQRYYALRDVYGSLAGMVTNFSQPIMPSWFPTGSMCRAGGRYETTDACSQANTSARVLLATKPWVALRSSVQDVVAAWAHGDVPNPVPRSVNFRATDAELERQLAAGTAGRQVVKAGIPGVHNTFLSEPTSRSWPADDFVQLQVGTKIVGMDPSYLWPEEKVGTLLFLAGTISTAAVLAARGRFGR